MTDDAGVVPSEDGESYSQDLSLLGSAPGAGQSVSDADAQDISDGDTDQGSVLEDEGFTADNEPLDEQVVPKLKVQILDVGAAGVSQLERHVGDPLDPPLEAALLGLGNSGSAAVEVDRTYRAVTAPLMRGGQMHPRFERAHSAQALTGPLPPAESAQLSSQEEKLQLDRTASGMSRSGSTSDIPVVPQSPDEVSGRAKVRAFQDAVEHS